LVAVVVLDGNLKRCPDIPILLSTVKSLILDTTDKTLFKDSSQNFNPNISSINDIYHKNINHGITKSDYQNYSWLFNNKRI
jgi:hypothetical protein